MLTAIAFVLIAASYVPGNRIKTLVGHPMVAGVAVWPSRTCSRTARCTQSCCSARSSYGRWSISSCGARVTAAMACAIRRAGCRATSWRSWPAVVWAVFALFLHGWLIGVRPFG